MARPHYQEVHCRQALNRVAGMGFRWSLNPYRGCVHGCHYCFARRFHAFFDLSPGEDFTGVIFVKVNIAQVLRQEVYSPSWRRESIAIGTATDPYQPAEGRYRLTRQCLEVLAGRRNPASLVTKGTMVVRDLDLLTDMARRGGVAVCISLTTLEEGLWRALEPGTPPPWQRLRALERLSAAGVNAGVLLAPVLPGITDGPANLEAVVRAAAEHGARFLGVGALYLKAGTKEHFLRFLEERYPHLLSAYRRLYPGDYLPKPFLEALHRRVETFKRLYRLDGAGAEGQGPRQLAMAL